MSLAFWQLRSFLGLLRHFSREVVGEYGSKPLYRSLGYFSIIGLLRVHVLLGDYTLALKVMDKIELNQKVLFSSGTTRLDTQCPCRLSSPASPPAMSPLIITLASATLPYDDTQTPSGLSLPSSTSSQECGNITRRAISTIR